MSEPQSKADPEPEAPAGVAHLDPKHLFSGSIHASEAESGLQWWEITTPLKLFTNVFVVDEQRKKLLLGWKKRGFGKEMYNGFGGKVEEGETPLEGAHRELEEEAGIKADLREIGILLFVNAHTDYCHYVHVYTAQGYQGEPTESDEMRPAWFAVPPEHHLPAQQTSDSEDSAEALPPIPYDKMWVDDIYWMPYLLDGEYFIGRMDFQTLNQDKQFGSWQMVRWWFGAKRDPDEENLREGRSERVIPPAPDFVKEKR